MQVNAIQKWIKSIIHSVVGFGVRCISFCSSCHNSLNSHIFSIDFSFSMLIYSRQMPPIRETACVEWMQTHHFDIDIGVCVYLCEKWDVNESTSLDFFYVRIIVAKCARMVDRHQNVSRCIINSLAHRRWQNYSLNASNKSLTIKRWEWACFAMSVIAACDRQSTRTTRERSIRCILNNNRVLIGSHLNSTFDIELAARVDARAFGSHFFLLSMERWISSSVSEIWIQKIERCQFGCAFLGT